MFSKLKHPSFSQLIDSHKDEIEKSLYISLEIWNKDSTYEEAEKMSKYYFKVINENENYINYIARCFFIKNNKIYFKVILTSKNMLKEFMGLGYIIAYGNKKRVKWVFNKCMKLDIFYTWQVIEYYNFR